MVEEVVSDDFRIGSWLVQPSLNTVSQNGKTFHIEPKVMEVLVCLARRAGETLSKQTLLQTVWPDTFVTDDVLTRSISELRRVFDDDAKESRFIQTISKRGYRLVASLEKGDGKAVGTVLEPGDTKPVPLKSQAWRRTWVGVMAVTAGVVVLAGILGGFNVGGLRERLLSRTTSTNIRSLAVLPLTNLSNDPAQESFADGMTDALITDLSQISALRVISRTTAMGYKKTDKPAPQIAQELRVDGIVEGTVQRSGNRVRITAQLIYGPKDQHLWAASYERDMQDAFAIQSMVARTIADEIRIKMTPQEEARMKNLRAVNPKALEAYLSGRFHLDQYMKLEFYRGKERARSEELRKALAEFDQAIALDAQYAPPYLWFFDGMESVGGIPLELIPGVEAGVAKVLQFDERNVRAHLVRARLLEQYEYDWPVAEKEIKRAIELNPNSADAHYQYAQYFLSLGRQEDEKRELDIAQALDPARNYFYTYGFLQVGWTLEQRRQAVEERAPDAPMLRGVLGKEYAIAGRFDESAEEYEKCLRLYGYTEFAELLHSSRTRAGGKAALRDWMRAREKAYLQGVPLSSFGFAFTYASLDDKDNAFRWLENAYQERNWCILYLKDDPVWDPLRSDSRFKDLLRRVGLPTQ
jgi:TolB-like protein/DNA-binding winged helix-turn-helix (wHTH) protein/tetratricopeptide (TPR) repeat protein